eukprot:COSAG01_NODE_43570_length_428_cov_1.486322_1_plen_94_part_00
MTKPLRWRGFSLFSLGAAAPRQRERLFWWRGDLKGRAGVIYGVVEGEGVVILDNDEDGDLELIDINYMIDLDALTEQVTQGLRITRNTTTVTL